MEVEAAFFSLAAAQLPALALVAGEAVFFLFFLKHIPGMCCAAVLILLCSLQSQTDQY